MALDAKSFYDRYWEVRERPRTEARSRELASAALDLLERDCVRPGRLLDAGCGPGWTLEAFRAAGFEAIGVDASSRAVDEARSRGLDARSLDIESQPASSVLGIDAIFDVVVMLEVLEHLVDPLGALAKALNLLAPAGRIVASLPNEIALPARLRVLCGRLPFGGHDDPHVRHFDASHARRLFDAAGLRVHLERPISVVPPHRGLLRLLARPALALFPGALSLATVYLLARGKDGPVGS